MSFHAVLCALQELKGTFELTAELQNQLDLIEKGCWEVLRLIEKELSHFKYLDTNPSRKRTWILRQANSLRYGSYNVSALREKVIAHTSSLAAFNSVITTLGAIFYVIAHYS